MHRTCAHPGCGVGFDACRIHHVAHWLEHHGPTDLHNLLPLCERHHHLVHEGNWTLSLDRSRVATWTRPDGIVHHRGSTVDRRPESVVASTSEPIASAIAPATNSRWSDAATPPDIQTSLQASALAPSTVTTILARACPSPC